MKPLPIDHAARCAAAENLDTTFFVEAAAGTACVATIAGRPFVAAKRALVVCRSLLLHVAGLK